MATEYDAMGNATGFSSPEPETSAQKDAQIRADKLRQDQTRQMQGLLKVGSGFPGKLTGNNDAATKAAVEKFQKDNGLDPAKASPEETLAKMRSTLIQNPKAVDNMKVLAGSNDPDNIKASQYGLAAFGVPLQPNGELNSSTTGALDRLSQAQARANTAAAKVTSPGDVKKFEAAQAAASQPEIDPQVQKLQGYMRGLGLTEVEVDGKKQPIDVTGKIDAATSMGMLQYKTKNGLDSNDSFDTVLKHMEDRVKQNSPEMQQRLNGIAGQGANASPMNVMALQLILNLLGPIISQLTGGKFNPEQLKVDGINGPRTTNAHNGYNLANTSPSLRSENTPATPAGGALKVDGAQPAQPNEQVLGKDGKWRPLEGANPNDPDPLGTFIKEKGIDGPSAQPQIRVRPGQETPGIQAAPGVIPTIVVGEESEPASAPSRRSVNANAAAIGASAGRERLPEMERPQTARYGTAMDLRGQYNNATGMEQAQRMMMARDQLESQGWAPAVAKQEVNKMRAQELADQGLDDRAIKRQVGQESKMADTQEKFQNKAERNYDRDVNRAIRDVEKAERNEARARDRGIAQDRRDWGALAKGGMVLGGGSSREASAAGQVASGVAGVIGRMTDGGFSGGGGARESRQMGNDMGNLARGAMTMGGASGREANAARQLVGAGASVVSRLFGGGEEPTTTRTVTFPQQRERPGYVQQPRLDQGDFSVDRSNQITGRMAGAAQDGVTAEQRAKIIQDYEAQRNAPATPATTSPTNNRQYNDLYSPG